MGNKQRCERVRAMSAVDNIELLFQAARGRDKLRRRLIPHLPVALPRVI